MPTSTTEQATDTPLPVATHTPTPTKAVPPPPPPSPTATSTPSPTATSTPPAPPCEPQESRIVDVMLVLDRSGSMKGRKFEDAKQAAATFVDLLDLGQSQVGLVTFAKKGHLDSPLTHDGGAVKAILDAVTTDNDTFLADGMRVADAELAGNNHNPNAYAVMIILSDGQADESDAEVRSVANAAKARGIYIVTIGLGGDADEDLLREIATSPADFYQAPSSSDLSAIYTVVAGVVACASSNPAPTPISSPTPTNGSPDHPTAEPLACIADTFVNSEQPNSSFGHELRLKASARRPERWSLIRCWAPSGVAQRVLLQLYALESGAESQFFGVTDGWDENTTWNTRPQRTDRIAELGRMSGEVGWRSMLHRHSKPTARSRSLSSLRPIMMSSLRRANAIPMGRAS